MAKTDKPAMAKKGVEPFVTKPSLPRTMCEFGSVVAGLRYGVDDPVPNISMTTIVSLIACSRAQVCSSRRYPCAAHVHIVYASL